MRSHTATCLSEACEGDDEWRQLVIHQATDEWRAGHLDACIRAKDKGKHFAHDALFHIVSHITTAMNRSTHVALHNACLPAIINTEVCGLTKLLEKVTRRLVTANRSRVSIHLVRQYEQT